ncbi:hypothetical protein DPSP01_002276 [Paraphaeosphaeria sporulosa]
MQNYGQHQAGYQRPGSTTGYPSAPAVPPPYGAPQGYQSAAPQAQSQWSAPTQNQTPVPQQWNQPQQQAGGYNPGVYGAMPGGYSQSQQNTTQAPTAYQSHQQDVPPPPPPKPATFAAAAQQPITQNWGQPAGYGAQQNASYGTHVPQGDYTQTSGYQGQSTAQQAYTATAPPPPSQTPAGSYFPPSQTPQLGGRPGSIYGADQAGMYSTPSSAVAQHPPSSVLSPNEQHPAYIPPSLSGQGVQSYVPSNTNPVPGVYVPPPPDIPAWQQASHAPLQGGKKFKYTKPAPDPNLYAQGQQGVPPAQAQGQYGQQSVYPAQQFAQNQYQSGGQAQQPGPYGNPVQGPYAQGQQQQQQQQGQYSQNLSQYGQPAQATSQPAPPYQHPSQEQSVQPQAVQPQAYQQQEQNQWQSNPPADQGYAQQQTGIHTSYGTQQQTWQPGHQAQGSVAGQQYGQVANQGIEAPKPVSGHTGTAPPGFVSEPSPQSQPVSPIQTRIGTGFNSGHTAPGRTDSVSSIALGAIHAQRAGNRTASPKPPPPNLPTPPPPRDDVTKFSVLGTGGPSDWEHFGGGEEIDDEEIFGAKKDGRHGVPVQLDSAEVMSQQVSPPQPQGEWPTPPVQPVSAVTPERDQYQPTPPPNTQRPPSKPPLQGFIVGNAPPPASQSQQNFVVGDAVVAPLRVSQPSSQRNTPAQQQGQHQPPPATSTSFSIDDNGQSQQRSVNPEIEQANATYAAELRTKDEALERVRAEAQQKESSLQAEVEQLKVVIGTTKSHAEYERKILADQIESMKTAAEQAKTNADASTRDKDLTIERWKEDSEGKEDTIKEKDDEIVKLRDELRAKEETIAQGHVFVDEFKKQAELKDIEFSNLKQQIENNQTAEGLANDLRQQLEAEKLKEPPKPTPASLIPDLDPWYAGSLERYIAMLRSEAQTPLVEDKIKVFIGFLKAESGARGLDYQNAPPSQPISQPQQESSQSTVASNQEPKTSPKLTKLNVHVPTAAPVEDDDIQYSPGGRPIVHHRPTLKSEASGHTQQSFSVSSQSTTVLTPTSSQDENASKTPTPVQSPPAEPQAQTQYKAYVPLPISQVDSIQSLHRQSVSSATTPALNPTLLHGSKKDEVFFGASTGTSLPSIRPITGTNANPEVAVPAPLFTQHPLAVAAKATPKQNAVEKLTRLLPAKIRLPQPNPQLEAVRKRLASAPLDLPSFQELTDAWEKSASLVRKKNDEARRKRQESSEKETDQLFDNHEISYADIAILEDEFKEEERRLKADEDRAEYQSYVDTVFSKVYDGLQQQIKGLMDLYIEVESLLSTAVSGAKTFEGSDAAVVEECLKLLEELFEKIEKRHDKVVEAVAERDKRYKKTEIQPLYAAGNIVKMKQVEAHFANAEKDAVQRARAEKADRVTEFVRIVESTVVAAVGVEQQEIQEIIAAVRDLPSSPDNEKLYTRAKETVLALGDSSKSLLLLLNDIEIDVGGSVLEVELAEAKTAKQIDKVAQLEKQISDREKELKEEFQRKEAVLDQDREEIEKLIKGDGGDTAEGGVEPSEGKSEEELKKERLSKALEAAKRRNGDL